MIRRDKVVCSALLIVIVVLAWMVVTYYFAYRDQNVVMKEEQATVLAMYAKDMYTQTQGLIGSFQRYSDFTIGDQNMANVTGDINLLSMLESRSFVLLGYEAGSVRDIIQSDSQALSSFDMNHEGQYRAYDDAYFNVSLTVSYAVNQLDWTTGRLPNVHQRLMYELCSILGSYLYVPTGNNTQLAGLSQAFFRVYVYWYYQSKGQPTSVVLSTELASAVGNATDLYQNLVDWHSRNPQ